MLPFPQAPQQHGELAQARTAFERAAKGQERQNSGWHAAKNWEKAGARELEGGGRRGLAAAVLTEIHHSPPHTCLRSRHSSGAVRCSRYRVLQPGCCRTVLWGGPPASSSRRSSQGCQGPRDACTRGMSVTLPVTWHRLAGCMSWSSCGVGVDSCPGSRGVSGVVILAALEHGERPTQAINATQMYPTLQP